METPPNRRLGIINVPLERGGAEQSWGRCDHTLGTLPGPSHHRLRLVGLLVGLERSHGGVWPKFIGWLGRLATLA